MLTINTLRPSYGQRKPTAHQPKPHSVLSHRQSAWTDHEIETVRSMWMANKSAGDIGERLGRSRNSVLGKVQRLGLKREERA